MLIFVYQLVQVYGGVDVKYDFYKAVGQIIYDKSGYGRHAVLGNSKLDTWRDMLQVTQRGIYSDGTIGADIWVTGPENDENPVSFVYDQDHMTIGCMQFSENSASWGTFFAHLADVDDPTVSTWVIAMQTYNNDVSYSILIKDGAGVESLQYATMTSTEHRHQEWNFHHMTIERYSTDTEIKYYINNAQAAHNTYLIEFDDRNEYQTIFGHREYAQRDENNGYIAMCVVLDTVQDDMSAYFTNSCENGLLICLTQELSGPITCHTPETDYQWQAWHGSCPACYTGTSEHDCDPCSVCGAGDQSCEFTPPDFVKCNPTESCDSSWETCNGTEDNECYTCIDPNREPDASPTGTCVCKENHSEFALSFTCTECDVAWATWFGTDYNECHTCRDGYYKQSSFFKWENTCSANEFENTTTNNCDTALSWATECNTCTGTTNDEWTGWAVGNYALDAGNTQCRGWAAECQEWNGSTSDDWTVWAINFAMLFGTNSCRATWPDLYYDDTTRRIWADCDATCATCNGPDPVDCLTWRDANAVVDGTTYLCTWNLNYYNSASSPTLQCEQCHAYWEECTANTRDSWQQCRSGFYMQTPIGTSATCNNEWKALENASSATRHCQLCHGTCGTSWTGTAATEWTDWADLNAALGGTGCECAVNFTNVDTTGGIECNYAPCAPECATCVGPSNDDWKRCSAGHYEQPSSSASCRDDWPNEYYPDDTNNLCQPWILPCKRCTDSSQSQCITWADENATSPSGVWECNDGYFNSFANSQTQVDCVQCDDGCASWEIASNNCLDCNSGYHKTENSICVLDCGPQWYGDDSDSLCHPCNEACQTCLGPSSDQCLSWRDANALVHPSGECYWQDGYYNSSTSHIQCVAWHAACMTCTAAGSNAWKECNTAYFRQPAPTDTYWHLTCPDGYGANLARKNCEQCHATCSTCDGGTSFDWIICADPSVLVSDEGRCEICEPGYYWDAADKTCQICHTDCATWDAFPTCLTCSDARANLLLSGICILPPCPAGEFAIPDYCQIWPNLWATCTAIDMCTSWVANAQIESGIWKCLDSTEQIGDRCLLETQLGPVPTLQIDADNNLLLSFDKALGHQLTKDDIVDLQIFGSRSEYEFTWEVQPQSDDSYLIVLYFSHDDIPIDTGVSLTLIDEFSDANGYQITTKSTQGILHEVKGLEDEDDDETPASVKRTADTLGGTTSGTSQASMSAAMVGGAATGDFGAAWNMMNSLQIIAFIPIMSTNLPLPLSQTLKGFLEFDIFPNFFEFMMDENDDKADKPYSQASDFGFDSSLFLFNAGEMLSQALVILLLLPLSLVLQRCGNASIASYFSDMLTSFHWSFFMRTWIEIYLEVLIAAYLQILSPGWDNSLTATNSILGYVFFFGLGASPLFVTGFMLVHRSTIANSNSNDKFSKQYGSLFSEFKNDKGVVSSMYYAWFFIRRIIYVANLIFLRHNTSLQFSINILHCVLNLSFLAVFLPYIGRLTNFVAIFTEIATIVIFSLWASFEMGFNSETEDKVMWVTIGTVFAIMFVNYIDICVCMYIGLKALYQKWKNRKQRPVNSLGNETTAKAKDDMDKTNAQLGQIQETEIEAVSSPTAKQFVQVMNSPSSHAFLGPLPPSRKPVKASKVAPRPTYMNKNLN